MPTITKITEQKRRPNRRNIHLDGHFAFGCNVTVVARFRLREGLALTDQQVQDIQLGEVRQECFDHAMRLLSMRLHSRKELATKLMRREYGPTVIDTVLEDLVRLGYVNDERFARTKALSAAEHRKQGRRRAYLELLKSGVGGDVARDALDEVYGDGRGGTESGEGVGKVDSMALARQVAQKQATRLRKLDPAVARRRLVALLQRRGFDYEAISPIIEEVLGRDADDSVP